MSEAESFQRIAIKHQTTQEINIHLTGTIEESEFYLADFEILRNCSEYDRVNLYISSTGGSLDTAMQYIAAMRDCQATIVAHLTCSCHSAATFIFLMADEWVVHPNSQMLIHNFWAEPTGRGKELIDKAVHLNNWCNKIYQEFYVSTGFLTLEELNSVLNDNTFWFTTEQINEKLDKVREVRSGKSI